MSVLDLPADARPREKLLARGPAALSDTELLALLLRTGLAGRGVLAMAQDLIERFGGLAGLLQADAGSLRQDFAQMRLHRRHCRCRTPGLRQCHRPARRTGL